MNPLLEAISSISKLHLEWSNILPRNPLLELNRQMRPPESIVSLNKFNTQIALQNENSQTVEDELNTILEILPANDFETTTIEILQEINSKLDKSSSWALRYFLISLIITFLLGFYANEIKNVTTNVLFKANNEESKEFSKMLKILSLQERIAKSNTFLRGKSCVNSGTVCSITQGQKLLYSKLIIT